MVLLRMITVVGMLVLKKILAEDRINGSSTRSTNGSSALLYEKTPWEEDSHKFIIPFEIVTM